MKKILLVGQLTDISGYGNAVRCYFNNLLELEEQGLIELFVFNYSFEENNGASEKELQEINKRSITKNLSHKWGFCSDPEEYKRVQKFMSNRDYEIVFYLFSDMLDFGVNNGSSKFHFQNPNVPEKSGDRFNIKELCMHSKGVYQCIAWESETIPHQWKNSLENKEIPLKKLFCACDWNRDTFSSLNIPSVTIPYSVGFEKEYDDEYYQKISNVTKDNFVFSSVFQWSNRKGVDILIKAFSLEFAENDDVCLILKTYINKAMKGADKNELNTFKRMIDSIQAPLLDKGKKIVPKFKIVIINDILEKKQINSIYKASDAFVLPTRGEGFCLPAAEAISYNLPVIVPNIGGHLGYMDIEESKHFLIDSKNEPCENMVNPLWSSIHSEWVEPSISSTRKKIRLAYENKDLCRETGIKQNKTMRNYLSKKRCVELLKEHILLDDKSDDTYSSPESEKHTKKNKIKEKLSSFKYNIINSDLDNKRAIEQMHNAFEGETCYILGCGPSLKDVNPNVLKDVMENNLVLTIKQAGLIAGKLSDFQIFNCCNISGYPSSPETIFVGQTDDLPFEVAKEVFWKNQEVNLSFNVSNNKDVKSTLAFNKNLDEWAIDKTLEERPWGPGIMYETVLFLAEYLGVSKIRTIGWDQQDPSNTKSWSHFYEDESKKHLLNPNQVPIEGEVDMAIKLSAIYHEWLQQRGIALEAMDSEFCFLDSSIPRYKL